MSKQRKFPEYFFNPLQFLGTKSSQGVLFLIFSRSKRHVLSIRGCFPLKITFLSSIPNANWGKRDIWCLFRRFYGFSFICNVYIICMQDDSVVQISNVCYYYFIAILNIVCSVVGLSSKVISVFF